MTREREITQEDLKSCIEYNHETGEFRRITKSGAVRKEAKLAGNINSNGYRQIRISGKAYFAHRLAFLYMTGSFPKEQCDHINGIRDDNRWSNLRDVSQSTNMRNIKLGVHNTSGVIGVCWNKSRRKWQAQIKVCYETKFLGCFSDISDAISARQEAEKRYGFHHTHGKR